MRIGMNALIWIQNLTNQETLTRKLAKIKKNYLAPWKDEINP